MPRWINAEAAREELERLYTEAMGPQQAAGGLAYTLDEHIRQVQQLIRDRTPWRRGRRMLISPRNTPWRYRITLSSSPTRSPGRKSGARGSKRAPRWTFQSSPRSFSKRLRRIRTPRAPSPRNVS
jgi:hypothetical protein